MDERLQESVIVECERSIQQAQDHQSEMDIRHDGL